MRQVLDKIWLRVYPLTKRDGPHPVTITLLTPALSLLAYWLGGETALLVVALGLPLIALPWALGPRNPLGLRRRRTRLMSQAQFEMTTKHILSQARKTDQKAAGFILSVDDFSLLRSHYGEPALDAVMNQIATRIQGCLREDDLLAPFGNSGFAICLAPQPTLDLEICLQVAGRITRAVAEPYAIDGTSLYLTASVGFCQLGREAGPTNSDTMDPVLSCAKMALDVAMSSSPGAIRAYTPETKARRVAQFDDTSDVAAALEKGEIVPWFQPQVSTDTGKISGFETLARWQHPSRGTLPPSEFLPQLDAIGQMGRLSEVMLNHALTALKSWDESGADIATIGVNFSPAELNDPHLVEKVALELERFELHPARLTIEILETVVAKSPDDVVTRNVKGLGALGCNIDLDDFGTGHASLASIRRFGVGRIKIDRSFVIKVDRDPEQKRMIRAILTMAEKLKVETLAEGVETAGEHSFLAQLGCNHVQGFGIGRPMPFEQTHDWILTHSEKIKPVPGFGQQTGS